MDQELIVAHLNFIDFLDVKNGKVSHSVKIPKENIPCTAQVMQVNCHGKVFISNDNKTIVINNWKTKIITLLDIETGNIKNNFDDSVSKQSSFICVLSPDGKYIASGSTDGKVKVWQVE